MLRRCGFLLWAFAAMNGLFLPGCMSIGIKNGIPYFAKRDEQFEPAVEEDKWRYVGQQARGNRELEDENDPLKSILMSKEAQDIERNLGYKVD